MWRLAFDDHVKSEMANGQLLFFFYIKLTFIEHAEVKRTVDRSVQGCNQFEKKKLNFHYIIFLF